MVKRATSFELNLPPRAADVPAHKWLYQTVRGAILEGRLRPGSRIPSTRDLAGAYKLSRGTVVLAFDQLKAEGYIEGTIGSGTRVSRVLPEELLQVSRQAAQGRKRSTVKPRLSDFGKRVTPLAGPRPRPSRAFRVGIPAVEQFPIELWTDVTVRCLRKVTPGLLVSCDPLGYLPLREVLADYLSTSRGVTCTPAQVAIVTGVQDALDLITRLLLSPGDRVYMEQPGYLGASAVFRAAGVAVVPLSIDSEGTRVPEGTDASARLAYLTPAHQFPLGTTMGLSRRLAFLEWARQTNAILFEDDYDSEYRYAGRPIPALQGLDRAGVVVFTGNFNKVLFPSLRLGYVVLPEPLIEPFAATFSVIRRHVPVLEQAVLARFIAEGHFGRHLRRMRELYSERLAVLLREAREHLSGLLEVSEVAAGLQTVGWLPDGVSGEKVAQAAAQRSVKVMPLSRYDSGSLEREGLHLGFAGIDEREIHRGVIELAAVLKRMTRR